MNPGGLNRLVTITTIAISTVIGRTVETVTTTTAYFKVTNIDGTRFFKEGEAIDKVVCKFEGWDNSYSMNMTLTLDNKIYKPIAPLKRNPGLSNLNEVIIIAATKC
jgi:hypothetical protein